MSEQSRPFLTAQWRNLILLNFEVDPATIIDRVPSGTTLDSWQGKTYITLVGFQFLDTKVLGAPIPFHQEFEEVNLRFYVRRVVDGEVRAGVVFICEVVPRQLVGGMARLLYREPYLIADTQSEVSHDPAPKVEYRWNTRGRWNLVAARGVGAGEHPEAHSCEEFLTQRNWGYNGGPGIDTLEYRVDHPRWRLWDARNVRFEADLCAMCGNELGRQLTRPQSVLLAEGSAVTIHWRNRIAE